MEYQCGMCDKNLEGQHTHIVQGTFYCEQCYKDYDISSRNTYVCTECQRLYRVYQLLYDCYKSGQVSEAQWQEHLQDKGLQNFIDTKRHKGVNYG